MKTCKIRNMGGFKWYCDGCPNQKDGKCVCKDGICMSPQNWCLRNRTEGEQIVKADIDRHHAWTLVKETDILDLVKNHNSFFMEILSNYPKKAYFDIDGFDPKKLDLITVKTIIEKYFPNEKMAISGYETDKKKSYHITLPNIILENDADMMQLKKLVKLISQNECEYFDWKVYTKNRAMKCIYQSKPKGDIQKIMENDNEKEHFITYFFTGKEKRLSIDLPEDLPQNELQLNELPKLKEPLKLEKEFSKDDLNDSKKLLKMAPNGNEFNHSYTWKVALFCFWNGLSFEDFWEWAKVKDNTEARKQKWKSSHWITISKSEYKMSKKGFIHLLSFYYPELVNVERDTDLCTRPFIENLEMKENVEIIERINQEHFTTDDKAVIFNIGMGGGKTTQTVEYLEKTEYSFIWLAPRQALVMNTFERFKEKKMDVINYLDYTGQSQGNLKKINDAKSLLLEAESLNKIRNRQKYNVLVIDEIETVLKNWDSETHKANIYKNFTHFVELFKFSKKVLLLDAFTTTATTRFLKQLDIGFRVYCSKYKPPMKTIKENTGYDQTVTKIANELDAGKKLYVFHAYKNENKKHFSIEGLKSVLHEKCSTKPKILVYHGDVSDITKRTLYNVNEEWDKYDCILTTSSITVGVNYEGDKFDKVYLMASGCVNNVRDVIQTSMRIRKTNETILEVFFFDRMDKTTYILPKFYHDSDYEYNSLYRNLIDDVATEKQANFIDVFNKFCELTNYQCNIKKLAYERHNTFVNKMFNSKMLMDYNSISELSSEEATDIETNKIWTTKATQQNKFEVNKYYFDKKYSGLDNDEKALIWNNRASSFFDEMKNELIERIIKDNGNSSLLDINYEKLQVSEETLTYIDKYVKTTIKNNTQKVVKLINSILGFQVVENVKKSHKSKATKYKISNLAEELYPIYEKYLQIKEEREKRRTMRLEDIFSDIIDGLGR